MCSFSKSVEGSFEKRAEQKFDAVAAVAVLFLVAFFFFEHAIVLLVEYRE